MPNNASPANFSANFAVKVLYVAGMDRSGSTLLGRLLGQCEGFANVGEIALIGQRWGSPSIRCGCGQVFAECPFWDRVSELAGDRENLGALYQAVAEDSSARIIVDTSKSVAYACRLNCLPQIDLRVVHLVRDSRAVAFSQTRRKLNPAFVDQATYMTPCSWHGSVRQWLRQNVLLHLRRPGARRLRLRYEDLASDPRAALIQIFALLDEPVPALDFLDARPICLGTEHTVSGNPSRFASKIIIQPDLEWHTQMSPSVKALVTAATFPLLAYYGYLRPCSSRKNSE